MIRLYLGLLGTGKTQRAIQEVKKRKARFVIYTPLKGTRYLRGGHPELTGVDTTLTDGPLYMAAGLLGYFKKTSGFYVTNTGNSCFFFRAAKNLTDCSLVLDDISTLCSNAEETNILEKELLPRLKWSGIETWITAHLPKQDVPDKARIVSDEIYWHGPLNDEYTIRVLFGMRRVNMTFKDFRNKLEKQGQFDFFRIK